MAEDRNALLDFLTRHYTLDGLKTLCFNLFIDYDNLSGDTKNAKGRELILHLERAGRLDDLEAVVGREQPRAFEREFRRPPPIPPIPTRPNRDPRQVFISHAHDAFAHRLADDLCAHGWRVWIAPDSITPGETWVDAINHGLEASSTYVLVLTPSAAASPWVNTETNVAISLEHQRLMRFIPLDVAPSSPPPLWTAYQNVPFRSDYSRGLDHLLARLDGRPPRARHANGDGDKAAELRLFADRRLHDRSRIELVRVAAGSFLYGARDADPRHERPQRTLRLGDYWIGRAPVTNAQFARFIEATGHVTTALTSACTTPSSASVGTTRRHSANGPACGCRPKLSGRRRPAAPTAGPIRGATRRRAAGWPTTACGWARRRPSASSRPPATAPMAWPTRPATFGSGRWARRPAAARGWPAAAAGPATSATCA